MFSIRTLLQAVRFRVPEILRRYAYSRWQNISVSKVNSYGLNDWVRFSLKTGIFIVIVTSKLTLSPIHCTQKVLAMRVKQPEREAQYSCLCRQRECVELYYQALYTPPGQCVLSTSATLIYLPWICYHFFTKKHRMPTGNIYELPFQRYPKFHSWGSSICSLPSPVHYCS